MPLWMQILATVTGVTGTVVPLLLWSERRRWRRAESWHCPECRSVLGAQPEQRFWAVRRNPRGARPTGGPVLHCPNCRRDFALQRFEAIGNRVEEFAHSKGFARCETEPAGAGESTVPRPSRSGCNPRVPWVDGTTVTRHRFAAAGSLSLGRQAE